MNKASTHTLIVRKVPKKVKDKLKRDAKKSNQSLNGYLLTILEKVMEEETRHVWIN